MGITAGVAGRIVVEGLALREGKVVTVLTREAGEPACLCAEEEAELLESVAQADRGETISAEDLFERLRSTTELGASPPGHASRCRADREG